ncbi:MAG: hypothetical protein ABGY75_03515, partial [Gemmataceae bacterium]
MTTRASTGLIALVFGLSAGTAEAQSPPPIPAGQPAIAVIDTAGLAPPGTVRVGGRYAMDAGYTLVHIKVYVYYFDRYQQSVGSETLTATTSGGVSYVAQSNFPPPNQAYGAKAKVEITVFDGTVSTTYGRWYNND